MTSAVAALDDADAAAPLLEKLGGLAQERRALEAELEGLQTRADAARLVTTDPAAGTIGA